MDVLLTLEVIAVITGIGFITLMIYQNIWCWPVGIVSSIASIFLFYFTKLYMESILYIFYVGIGIYGWTKWNQQKSGVKLVTSRGINYHLIAVLACASLSAIIGWISSTYTDADRPYADASSTMFSFVASYMEAHRILSSWIFWIIINLFTIWLYMDKGLSLYAGMMVLYFLLSVAGFLQWKKDYDKQNLETSATSSSSSSLPIT
jgi:nicotinamide mononucleotide transporter